MAKNIHTVSKIVTGGIAQELEIEPGDKLLSINGREVEDIFDYHYLINDEYLEILVEKEDGEVWELEIEKDFDEDLGMEFENGLMDEYRSCRNKCVFCFIDQMPSGMRETLYFKDDDSRLSFLQGNYVTLTNMSDHDIERIITYHLEPINVSIHTMNPELRCRMLNNRFAGEALKKVDRLCRAGIHMNGQIVLCKGINDGEELEYSIQMMSRYLPYLQSVSVVPVGLTKYREGLYPLKPFEQNDARQVLSIIHRWQDKLYREHGTHFIHAGDEWYLMAGEELPREERYDGYLQLENGVGMLRLLTDEVEEELRGREGDERKHVVSIATGLLAAPVLEELVSKINERYPNVDVRIYPIKNDFFGDRITVSGLLTGGDLRAQLAGRELGRQLLLPCNVLRSGEEVFLDDLTVTELETALQTPVNIVKSTGRDFVRAVLLDDKEVHHAHIDEVNKYE
ncbi:MAG: DUF512 domain-containing protein [Lachnospiraceae bacterium]|jgi:putative radical SAM enzyme (TIGR03279 family)|nr:DUF512 domain-containing protein [Lachnospiraceae bacterium]